jgi:hypothetical protein
MVCEALVLFITVVTMPDTGMPSTHVEEVCAASNKDAQERFALRRATLTMPGQPPVRVTAKVYLTMPNGDRVHVYDLPAPAQP